VSAWLRARQKCLAVVGGTAVYGVQAALSDGRVTGTEAGGIIAGLAFAFLVYVVPNVDPPAPAGGLS
jgi:hypothetical protein